MALSGAGGVAQLVRNYHLEVVFIQIQGVEGVLELILIIQPSEDNHSVTESTKFIGVRTINSSMVS